MNCYFHILPEHDFRAIGTFVQSPENRNKISNWILKFKKHIKECADLRNYKYLSEN